MAKQRGVVQLSGRVDNLCYYQQKRVRGGLVRRINLAMSERVKAGEEYANLRSANSFFGACSMIAAALINLVNQRVLFMTRSDRQSYLTTKIYQELVTYGMNSDNKEISYNPSIGLRFAVLFNSIMKVKPSEFFLSLPIQRFGTIIDETAVFTIPSVELDRYLAFFKGEAVAINFYYDCYIYFPYYVNDTGKYAPPESGSNINRTTKYWRFGDSDIELHIHAGLHDDTFSSCIIQFSVVKYFISSRPVILDSASTSHMINFVFS